MTIPKRFNEVLEEQTSYNVNFTIRNIPIQWKTGGVSEDGIIVEAIIDNTRVGALMAANDGTGNYVLDTIIVAPEYRRRGIAMNMMHKAHASVPMLPYYLTPDPVYKSEAGRQLGYKELSIYGNGARPNNVRTAAPLIGLIPEAVGIGADLIGGAAAGEAAAGAAAIPSIGAAGVASSAAAPIAADVAAGAIPSIGGAGVAAAGETAAGTAAADTAAAGESAAAQAAKGGLWSRLKGFAGTGLKQMGLGSIANHFLNSGKNGQGGGSSGSAGAAPYGGFTSGGGPVQVHVGSLKQSFSDGQEITRLLELILEVLCACGRPTGGKFNGMPHCVPGSGCSTGTGNDYCCSCGNPDAAGSFHGESLCAPGQGCNEHWTPGSESPAEKIADHDHWASQTNHGQFDMPGPKKPLPPTATTWE